MSHCASHIWDLESHPSRLNKEAIIEQIAQEGNDEFFQGYQLALDPMVTFGVKQVPEKKDEDGPGFNWDSFVVLASGLRNRNLTGLDARDAIAEAIKQATQKEWYGWYRRILIKDLRCGTSV
jgi:DNA ligase-1